MINNNYSQISFGKKYCYIPKCKARCCSGAPLPETLIKFVNKDKIVRPILMTFPAPKNNPYCENAVIPITKPIENYIIKSKKRIDGRRVFELDTNKVFADPYNFCPFLNTKGRCNIYEQRPAVCRDFGKKGWFDCDQMVTRKELIKLKLQTLKNALKMTFDSLIRK